MIAGEPLWLNAIWHIKEPSIMSAIVPASKQPRSWKRRTRVLELGARFVSNGTVLFSLYAGTASGQPHELMIIGVAVGKKGSILETCHHPRSGGHRQ